MNGFKEYNKHQRKFNKFNIVDDYVICTTTDGREFYIDLKDLELIRHIERCWYIHKLGYVHAKLKGKAIKLHNYIMKPDVGFMVDHIDGNPLNNRKSNLRICKEIDNAKNKRTPTNNTSGVKGVNWNIRMNKWHVRVGVNNKRLFIGYYDNINDAIQARKNAEEKYHKEFSNNR